MEIENMLFLLCLFFSKTKRYELIVCILKKIVRLTFCNHADIYFTFYFLKCMTPCYRKLKKEIYFLNCCFDGA